MKSQIRTISGSKADNVMSGKANMIWAEANSSHKLLQCSNSQLQINMETKFSQRTEVNFRIDKK